MRTKSRSAGVIMAIVIGAAAMFVIGLCARPVLGSPQDASGFPEGYDGAVHPGRWSVHWMKPEPMHAIETVENYYSPSDPPSIRVEIKVPP
jgi:hypothetical protein